MPAPTSILPCKEKFMSKIKIVDEVAIAIKSSSLSTTKSNAGSVTKF